MMVVSKYKGFKMRKLIIGAVAVVGILLFSGCAGSQPTFNPKNIGFRFIQGKPYLMPKYVASFYVGNEARTVTSLGLCRRNGILWVRADVVNQIGFAANGSDESAVLRRNVNTVKQMMRNGSAGCSYPLSNQEYQYVLHMQNQAQANARVNSQNITNSLNNRRTNRAIRNSSYTPYNYGYGRFGY